MILGQKRTCINQSWMDFSLSFVSVSRLLSSDLIWAVQQLLPCVAPAASAGYHLEWLPRTQEEMPMMTGHVWQLWPEFDCHTHFHEVWSVERQNNLPVLNVLKLILLLQSNPIMVRRMGLGNQWNNMWKTCVNYFLTEIFIISMLCSLINNKLH